MPRYFFHRTDGFVEHDTEGTEFENLDAARIAAIVFAGESMRGHPDYVWNGQEFRVEVMSDDGQLLMTIVTLSVDARSVQAGSNRAET